MFIDLDLPKHQAGPIIGLFDVNIMKSYSLHVLNVPFDEFGQVLAF